MKGDARSLFLDRVRHAAERGKAYRVHLHAVPPDAGYVGGRGDDLCAAMANEVNDVGGYAHLVDNLAGARAKVSSLLQEYGARTVLAWKHDLLARLELEQLLAQANIGLLDHDVLATLDPASRRTAIMGVDVGVTSCDAAIAETGSLMMCSSPGHERVASLVAPVHIAVIKRSQIVPDLFDAFKLLQEKSGSSGETPRVASNVVLITGPSKTGDIELTLTTGVHGPGKWHVVIVT